MSRTQRAICFCRVSSGLFDDKRRIATRNLHGPYLNPAVAKRTQLFRGELRSSSFLRWPKRCGFFGMRAVDIRPGRLRRPQAKLHFGRIENSRSRMPWHAGDLQAASRLTSTSRSPRYQGIPFKSGASADCSGNPPAIRISDMTSMPAHPPPKNAVKTHQNETIGSLLLALRSPGKSRPDCAAGPLAASSRTYRAAAASIFPGCRRASPSSF